VCFGTRVLLAAVCSRIILHTERRCVGLCLSVSLHPRMFTRMELTAVCRRFLSLAYIGPIILCCQKLNSKLWAFPTRYIDHQRMTSCNQVVKAGVRKPKMNTTFRSRCFCTRMPPPAQICHGSSDVVEWGWGFRLQQGLELAPVAKRGRSALCSVSEG
jgi:hypothetical protein